MELVRNSLGHECIFLLSIMSILCRWIHDKNLGSNGNVLYPKWSINGFSGRLLLWKTMEQRAAAHSPAFTRLCTHTHTPNTTRNIVTIILENISYLGSNLITALASLNVNDFPHLDCLFKIVLISIYWWKKQRRLIYECDELRTEHFTRRDRTKARDRQRICKRGEGRSEDFDWLLRPFYQQWESSERQASASPTLPLLPK